MLGLWLDLRLFHLPSPELQSFIFNLTSYISFGYIPDIMAPPKEYLLGISPEELERMRFQHGVWKHLTDGFLDRLDVGPGSRCLDVGAGPGFVTMDLRERAGSEGTVTALEPSRLYLDYVRSQAQERGWTNVETIQSNVEDALLPEGSFDLAYIRWVIDFVPDRRRFLHAVASSIKPGGLVAIEDYFYEGLSVHPRGTDFDRMADIVRRYYHAGGGNPYAVGDVPKLLREEQFGLVQFVPQQQVGGMESPVFRWAYKFFRLHLPMMAERGVIDAAERSAKKQKMI